MCSVPVTFGGGSWMQYGAPSPCGANTPAASQRAYHLDSRGLGSKLLSMIVGLVGAHGAVALFVLVIPAHAGIQFLVCLSPARFPRRGRAIPDCSSRSVQTSTRASKP